MTRVWRYQRGNQNR